MQQTFTQEDVSNLKLAILGYKKDTKPLPSIKGLSQIENLINNLKLPEKFDLPSISLEEVKTGAKAFYDKYFTIHSISSLPIKTLQDNYGRITSLPDGPTIAEHYNSLTTTISPFELPIEIVQGQSMLGSVKKALILTPAAGFKENINIPFSHIELGNNLTQLSTATYIHEISHTQAESIPGYTESYYNKEVISIFLEKLAILEQDPSGNLLKVSERARFAYCNELIKYLKATDMLKRMNQYSYEQALEASAHIISTLYATKLFDKYQNAKKTKEKTRILSSIQDVFDGKQTIEELLSKEGITQGQIKDINLVKRHI